MTSLICKVPVPLIGLMWALLLGFPGNGDGLTDWTRDIHYWRWRLTGPWHGQHIRVAAFNIKSFGRSKMKKPEVANIIKQIVLEYDIILIQEIRDRRGKALRKLHNLINMTAPYGLVKSRRVGTSSYKEQYAFFYRPDKLTVLKSYIYRDSNNEFERDPFSVLVKPNNTDPGAVFAVIGIHTKPMNAVTEIKHLYNVYEDLLKRWNVSNVMVIGDMNADCSYASIAQLRELPIYMTGRFRWLINNDADTTTSKTNCAYDRLLYTGRRLTYAVLPWTAGPYLFDQRYGLTNNQTKAVSDHYPVHVDLMF
ncbi:deoxyribonuclease-1-like [Ylistrum balloti]|uniref:deoxyribonuclease-1-like n=1 Tax=Ylistrum balloti TaxID=509963 RepID=UPI002905A1F9|nr:deoxyribonuclease-1-like [Ylistrum balloti]